jgi:hypothetical protein
MDRNMDRNMDLDEEVDQAADKEAEEVDVEEEEPMAPPPQPWRRRLVGLTLEPYDDVDQDEVAEVAVRGERVVCPQ